MALDQKDAVLAALRQARWVKAEAARLLGVSRQALYGAMERHGIPCRRPPDAVYREVQSRCGRLGGRPRKSAAA